MKIELKPRKKDKEETATPTLTPEQIAALEKEKAEILFALDPKRRPTAQEPQLEANPIAPAPVAVATEPTIPVPDMAAVKAEREQLERDLKALEAQLIAVKQREKQAAQLAIAAAARQQQAVGAKQLAPLQPRLERHLAEVSRVQATYGPILRDMARSMATGYDAQQRQAKAEAYRAAQPLGARLGDARATIESALKGSTLAMQSSQPHVYEQARVLADAALAINLVTLETDCASLVQLIRELNPDFTVSGTTPDHMRLPAEPHSRTETADFGRSIN